MGSTFNKRYELLREKFFKTTGEFPQLKTNAAGKAKSSGIGDDAKALDALLDAEEKDVAKLTKVFQDFTKHARSYAEQISYAPGKGIYDWMEIKAGKPVDPKQAKTVKEASIDFQNGIETLIKDVDGTVAVEMSRGKSRDQTVKAIGSMAADVATWGKYLDLAGITSVMDKRTTLILANPRTGKPPTDVLTANANLTKAIATLGKLIGAGAKVDPKGRKAVMEMEKVMQAIMDAVQDIKNNLLQWNNEYKAMLTEWERKLKTAPDPAQAKTFESASKVLSTLMPTVDQAKQKIGTNLELKVIANRKLLANL